MPGSTPGKSEGGAGAAREDRRVGGHSCLLMGRK